MDQGHASEVFRALGVPNRMHILMLLKSDGPLPVKTIAERLDLTPPAVSQHLKVLRHAGLVHSERKGYVVPYAVDANALNNCCGMMVNLCAHPRHTHGNSRCECHSSEADRLMHRREELLRELQRVETALEALRTKDE